MVKKLMNKKRDNKGFSLVELIVVVLIIAIIAVALAPQVMKWVGTSKENVDANNAATIKSAANAGVAEYLGDGGTISSQITFTVNTSSLSTTAAATAASNLTQLQNNIVEALNNEFPQKQNVSGSFSIIVSSGGAVTVN